MSKTNVIVDLSNIVWACRHTIKTKEFTKALLIHKVLDMIRNNVSKFNADGVMIACDSPRVWRKDLYPAYKGNRDEDRDELYDVVKETMIEIAEFFNTCTSIPAVSVDRAEADDIIAVAAQTNPNNHVILSGDKDFVQLINSKTRVYSPIQSLERTTTDAKFDLFLKCIRGDRGDNIMSAYPRVWEAKVRTVYESQDPTDLINFMATTLKDGTVVQNNFDLNKALIDLRLQPSDIRNNIVNVIATTGGQYSQVGMIQFLGRYDLVKLAKQSDKFANLFKKRYL